MRSHQKTSVIIKYFSLVLLAGVGYSSCKPSTNPPALPASPLNKDSVVRDYLAYLDTSGRLDTSDFSFKTLNAYLKNDTTFFRWLDRMKGVKMPASLYDKVMDSCIRLQKIQGLGADEAYRFMYTASFCPYLTIITVTNKGDSSNLNFVLLEAAQEKPVCHIISNDTVSLTKKEWEDFGEAMRKADFWGLKSENGRQGGDGDDIYVWGYKAGSSYWPKPAHFSYVQRWGVAESSLAGPYSFLLRLAHPKEGCTIIK